MRSRCAPGETELGHPGKPRQRQTAVTPSSTADAGPAVATARRRPGVSVGWMTKVRSPQTTSAAATPVSSAAWPASCATRPPPTPRPSASTAGVSPPGAARSTAASDESDRTPPERAADVHRGVRGRGCVEGEAPDVPARERAGGRQADREPEPVGCAACTTSARHDVDQLRAVEGEREPQHVRTGALELEAVLQRELVVRPLRADGRPDAGRRAPSR